MPHHKKQKFFPLESQLRLQGFKLIAGMDEVGRGPLAGPVVSAAVILKDKTRLPGLDDSKKLSASQRTKLFNLILDNCIDYSITAISHVLVDQYNVLNAIRFANDLCISELIERPDIAIIDGHDKQIIDIPFITVVKGDSHIRSVAAASILAKVVRDAIMHRYAEEFPDYGFEKHVGYGTRLHRSCLAKHGICAIHRKSFQLLKHENSSMW